MTGLKIMRLVGDMLVSPIQDTPWPRARMEVAGAPQPAACGIHAYHDLAALQADNASGWQPDRAIVEVEPDGETVIGETGWVAQAASITRIWVPRQHYHACYDALHGRYGVSVSVFRSLGFSPRRLDLATERAWIRTHYGPEYAYRHLPSLAFQLAFGSLTPDDQQSRSLGSDLRVARTRTTLRAQNGRQVSLIVYHSLEAAASRELHAAATALRRAVAERRAREERAKRLSELRADRERRAWQRPARDYIRERGGWAGAPLFIGDSDDAPPRMEGRPYRKTHFVRHYRSGKTFARTLYTPSTQCIVVGKSWLEAQHASA